MAVKKTCVPKQACGALLTKTWPKSRTCRPFVNKRWPALLSPLNVSKVGVSLFATPSLAAAWVLKATWQRESTILYRDSTYECRGQDPFFSFQTCWSTVSELQAWGLTLEPLRGHRQEGPHRRLMLPLNTRPREDSPKNSPTPPPPHREASRMPCLTLQQTVTDSGPIRLLHFLPR